MEEWRLLPLDLDCVGNQLARSEALFSGLSDGEGPTLHWYLTNSPAIVLGLNQQPTLLDLAECVARRLQVFRRRGGGNIVHLSPSFLSLDLALPPGHPLQESDIVRAYEWVGNLWTTTLQNLGLLEARTIPLAEARASKEIGKRPGDSEEARSWQRREKLAELFCFGTLSPFETVVSPLREGLPPRKIVGLCQIRRRSGTVWQAGLAQHWDPQLLSKIIAIEPEEQDILAEVLLERAAGLHDLGFTTIDSGEVISAFQDTLQEKYGVDLIERGWTPLEEEKAGVLREGTYRNLEE